MKRAILMLSALLLIAGGATAIVIGMQYHRPAVEVRALEVNPATTTTHTRAKKDLPAWIDSFQLTERSGKEFDSRNMEGKVWAASFFFGNCPGECQRQNKEIARLQEEFGKQGVTFVSITVDPERDTPERLREYARDYTKSPDQWLFLTGDLSYIRRIGAEFFGVAVDKGTHGSRLILVDKWGNLRGYYSTNGSASPEEFAAIHPTLKQLLAETEEPEEFKKKDAPKEETPSEEPAKDDEAKESPATQTPNADE
jgi:protein SCO1/2